MSRERLAHLLVTGALIAVLVALVVLTRGFTAIPSTYTMTGESMEPAVGKGDWFLARPLATTPARGELVVLEHWIDDTLYYVLRRVVGLPGDTLVMGDGDLRVNGAAAPWPARVVVRQAERPLDGPIAGTIYNWGPVVVGPESVFALSDTRDMLGWPDSRFFGPIPRERIVDRYVGVIRRGTPSRKGVSSTFPLDAVPRRLYVFAVPDLHVPRVTTAARLLLTQGVSRPGTLYLVERASQHAGPETPLEMLNREDAFFPFRPDEGDGIMLIAKAHTVSVSVDRQAPITDPTRLSAATTAGVELVLAGGSTLGGWASYELPPGHARVIDYLNTSAASFFAVWTHATTHYVNRAHVMYARPLE